MNRLPKIDIYVAKLVAGPFAVFTLILTGIIWLTQSLELLDDVIEKGQDVSIFLYLSVLVVPSILTIVLPLAFFFASLYALYRLRTDSELVVMFSTGMSQWRVARAMIVCGIAVMIVVYAVNLYFLPTAMREMRSTMLDMRTDLVSGFLRAGEFTSPAKGLTVFVNTRLPGGQIEGLLVHDNRDTSKPVTYVAERGTLVKTNTGPRLVMLNGNIQQRDEERDVQYLYFDKYTYDLSQFSSDADERYFKGYERYLHELLWPDMTVQYDAEYADELRAQGHARLTSPLFTLLFLAVALAGLMPAEFNRRGYSKRMIVTVCAGLGLRLLDLATVGWAARAPILISVQYLLPIGGIIFASAMVNGWHPSETWARITGQTDEAEGSAGA